MTVPVVGSFQVFQKKKEMMHNLESDQYFVCRTYLAIVFIKKNILPI
jgi:hypothetical protein